jgi:hypothetical protein
VGELCYREFIGQHVWCVWLCELDQTNALHIKAKDINCLLCQIAQRTEFSTRERAIA